MCLRFIGESLDETKTFDGFVSFSGVFDVVEKACWFRSVSVFWDLEKF